MVITRNGAPLAGASGVVGSGGSFAIQVNASLNAGDLMRAHGGGATGPSANTVSVAPAPAGTPTPPAASIPPVIAGGASVITVNGQPGSTVLIVADPDGPGPEPEVVLGSAVIPASGQVGVILTQPLPSGATAEVVINGMVQDSFTATGSGAPPVLVSGSVLTEGSTLIGTGTPGALVQAVDSLGNILGSAVVDAQGQFTLAVSGATAGTQVNLAMNGVKAPGTLPGLSLGSQTSFTSANVFKPDQGGTLSIGFKAEAAGLVTVKVYNLAGELIRPIFETTAVKGLLYQANWDGRNGEGSTVSSGVYFVSVRGAGIKAIKKVIVLK